MASSRDIPSGMAGFTLPYFLSDSFAEQAGTPTDESDTLDTWIDLGVLVGGGLGDGEISGGVDGSRGPVHVGDPLPWDFR